MEHIMTQLDLQVESSLLPLFFPLFEKGVVLSAEIGCSVKDFLCGQLGISEDYLDQRIQTLFLDFHPVDDVNTAVVRDGSTLALSAAMPGLVGATMRKGGRYAAFRQDISQCREDDDVCKAAGRVTLKMFNMVASELGDRFLEAGVEIDAEDLKWIADRNPKALPGGIVQARLDGRETALNDDLFSGLAGRRFWFTVRVSE